MQLEIKIVHIFVGKYAGQHVVSPCIGEKINVEMGVKFVSSENQNDLSQCLNLQTLDLMNTCDHPEWRFKISLKR